MPVNYQQFQNQLREQGKKAKDQEKERAERLQRASDQLDKHANDLDSLRELVEKASQRDRGLRCAVPLNEPLTCAKNAVPPADKPVLLATDGSQVNPSRHDAVEFALINIGMIRMAPEDPPSEMVESRLFMFDDLRSEQGPLTEDLVALQRDVSERVLLAQRASREPQPVVTLTDGPLELFGEPKDDARFKEFFRQYLDALVDTASMNVCTAGFVDKPRADLVVRLLEFTLVSPEESQQTGRPRPLFGVTDNDLFEERLAPGQRTAVFAVQSTSAQKFKERDPGLALHFFYLNVGREGQPWLARVEIPAWVSRQPDMINLLQHTLLDQCEALGARPYPYALHRAHEIAVVSMDEKNQLENLIAVELARHGVIVGLKSSKQSAKDLNGRGRYGA